MITLFLLIRILLVCLQTINCYVINHNFINEPLASLILKYNELPECAIRWNVICCRAGLTSARGEGFIP